MNRSLTALLLLLACLACHPSPLTPRHAAAPPPYLLPVDALAVPLFLRQRLTARWSTQQQSFDAVLQKRPGELSLIGLGPMNSVAFILTLSRHGIRLDNRLQHPVPFAPQHILADIQRVYYPWFERAARCQNCQRQQTVHGTQVQETYRAGHLVQRRFLLSGQPPSAAIVVNYYRATPARIVLTNPQHRYRLTIAGEVYPSCNCVSSQGNEHETSCDEVMFCVVWETKKQRSAAIQAAVFCKRAMSWGEGALVDAAAKLRRRPAKAPRRAVAGETYPS